MEPKSTSDDLLAHFDRPKAVNCPDFEWVDDGGERAVALRIAADDAAMRWEHIDDSPPSPAYTRGVMWVLQWSAAIAVLLFAAGILFEFACLMSAERSLYAAARAGATEATLPRATYQSIAATVERRLAGYPQMREQLQFTLLQNGVPVGEPFRVKEGDRLSITLSAPPSSIIPAWLRRMNPWGSDTPIAAHAEREMPGRKLRLAKN